MISLLKRPDKLSSAAGGSVLAHRRRWAVTARSLTRFTADSAISRLRYPSLLQRATQVNRPRCLGHWQRDSLRDRMMSSTRRRSFDPRLLILLYFQVFFYNSLKTTSQTSFAPSVERSSLVCESFLFSVGVRWLLPCQSYFQSLHLFPYLKYYTFSFISIRG